MSIVENFLNADEETQIINAIRDAERTTSGEIRVHLEKHTDLAIMERAAEVFHWLKMDTTELHNGVLIYVAVEDHQFAIYGDTGINEVVPDNFWESTKDVIQKHFKNGEFAKGLINGIELAGSQLQQYFPWNHGTTNELSDTISKKH